MKKEMNRILQDEIQHISPAKAKRWQPVFRMTYKMIRRQDLDGNPATKRRESFLRCIENIKRTFPEFNPVDLDYDTAFFGPVPLDNTRPLDASDKERLVLIAERDKVMRR